MIRDPGALKRVATSWLLLLHFLLAACAPVTLPDPVPGPPVAGQRHFTVVVGEHRRQDPWYWLRDDARTDPDVLAYLEAENAYTRAGLAHTSALQRRLRNEMSERIDPDESGVPWRDGNYWYLERYRPGQEYPVVTRRPGVPHAPETVILDANERAGSGGFYALGMWSVSPDGRLLAITEDRAGREQHDLRVRDLVSGDWLADRIPAVAADIAWASDNRALYYLVLNDALRPYQVRRHVLGTAASTDTTVYEESDSTFNMSLSRSRDGQFVLIQLVSTLSTETRLIDALPAGATSRALTPRMPAHQYVADMDGDAVFILSDLGAPNFRLMRTTLGESGDPARWREILPERADVALLDLLVFERFVAVNEVQGGTVRIRIVDRDGGGTTVVPGRDPAYLAAFDRNPGVNTDTLRYEYSSLVTPTEVRAYTPRWAEDRLLKEGFAGAHYDRAALRIEAMTITARDGTAVPVTLMHRRDARPDGTRPLFLVGYGAYGAVHDGGFVPEALSLVERGFGFAIAHVRGGGENGRAWYDAGRVLNKKNTFTDFIDVAQGLVAQGWAAPDRVVGFGRSAGGLLIGAVANEYPNPFSVLVTEVPFVDVVTTMADETIPLTSYEWDEWGDPRRPEHYEYMLSYSPYDQVRAQPYPHLLVTAGLWDARVQYWEPAKWVARLRATKRGDSRLFFSVDMDAGHAGRAGRYERLDETAMEYAFILDTLGMSDGAR